MVFFNDFRTFFFIIAVVGVCFASAIIAKFMGEITETSVKAFLLLILGAFVVAFPLAFSERLWWADMLVFLSIAAAMFLATKFLNTKHPLGYSLLVLGLMVGVLCVEIPREDKIYNANLIVLNEEVYKETKREQYELTGSGLNRSANVELFDVEYGLCVVTYEDRDDCEVVWTDRYEVTLNQNYRKPRREERLAEKIITIKMPAPLN